MVSISADNLHVARIAIINIILENNYYLVKGRISLD